MKFLPPLKQLTVLFIVTAGLLQGLQAQSADPVPSDSLISLLPASTGLAKVHLLDKISSALVKSNPQEAIKYGEEGLGLAAEAPDTLKASILSTLSVSYGKMGNFTRQLILGRQALEIYKASGDERKMTRIMSVIAMAYFNLGDFESSLRIQLEVLKIREMLWDYRGLVGSYNNLGIVYQRLNQLGEAINSYRKALEYIEMEKMDFTRGAVLNNLGSLYSRTGKNDQAFEMLNKALELHEKTGDKEGLALTHVNLGVVYTSLGKNQEALDHYQEAMKLSEETGDKHGIAITAQNLGVINQRTKNFPEAYRYYHYCMQLALEEGFRDIEMDTYQNLAGYYSDLGDYKQAYGNFKRYAELRDSLFTEETNQNMSRMRAMYEADRKEQDNILLNQQLQYKELQLTRRQVTIYFAVVFLLVLLVFSVSLYKSYLQKKKALKKELELNRLISRFVSTVSHEFRTPLAGISSSVQLLHDFGQEFREDERTKLYAKITDSVSDLKSMLDDVLILEQGQSKRVEVKKNSFVFEEFCGEVIRDTLALTPEKPGINISASSAEPVGMITTDRELLRHILSNIISNAVKYSGQKGEVSVVSHKEGSRVIIRVTDNGRGIPQEDIPYLYNDFYRGSNAAGIPGTGLGMSIVKNALGMLGGTIDLQSELHKGTTVEVVIPVSENEK